ncbi:NCA2-domain-containing protein [Flagelloscypha sp. PMI_526]|nr:NCA2-domain-containing protein [Flagelloscypha sp. PMI_526]
MPSSFIEAYTKPLAISPDISTPPTPNPAVNTNSEQKQKLQSLFATLQNQKSRETLQHVSNAFLQIPTQGFGTDSEETLLRSLIVRQLVVDLYADTLQLYLAEAVDAEKEAEWWATVGRTRWNRVYYFIQTAPPRFLSLLGTIHRGLQAHDLPLQLSSFSPSNLYRLFPSRDSFHPSDLVTSLFPHLRHQKPSYQLNAASFLFIPQPPSRHNSTIVRRLSSFIIFSLQQLSSFVAWPLELTRHEIHFKRKELERIRDARAEDLGTIAQLRTNLEHTLQGKSEGRLSMVVDQLNRVIAGEQDSGDAYLPSPSDTPGIQPPPTSSMEDHGSLVHKIAALSARGLPLHIQLHETDMSAQHLRRPRRLTLIWPKLLVIPPVSLYMIYALYSARTSVWEFMQDAKETASGFLRGWIVEPVKDILKTVRAGSAQSIVIQEEAVRADIESLERMVLALAQDHLKYTPEQLNNLSHQIHAGDLTPVLKLYEDDIKQPLKSTLTGTLLRTLFIQVQKAKVDIDQALSGIDKLLKSQELTFAFVGLAPALGIVYLGGSYFNSVWRGGRGRGRYGGKRRRSEAWSAMRRIERLLSSPSPSSTSMSTQFHQLPHTPVSAIAPPIPDAPIAPVTAGLLLLSVTRLRHFGDMYLPTNSKLRSGFLEDVEDLENPTLTRTEKLKVVERMWRCWGSVLGWAELGHA